MTSRQLKEIRRRQARDAAAAAERCIDRHDRRAAEADAASLLNEAIYHANLASHWRQRRNLVAQPRFHALRSRERAIAIGAKPSN